MTLSFRKKLGTFRLSITPLLLELTAHENSPTRGVKYTRFSRVISQSSHGLYCEIKLYVEYPILGASRICLNLGYSTHLSSIVSAGGNMKFRSVVHFITGFDSITTTGGGGVGVFDDVSFFDGEI